MSNDDPVERVTEQKPRRHVNDCYDQGAFMKRQAQTSDFSGYCMGAGVPLYCQGRQQESDQHLERKQSNNEVL